MINKNTVQVGPGLRAKKSLGQHFLRSKNALSAIIDAGDVVANDIILEIGPGTGNLTEKLLFFAGKVIAIEKDRELVVLLKEKFKKEIESGKLELIEKDILEFDEEVFSFYKDLNYKIIANIPYNITGAILKKFLSAKTKPYLMVLLIQKEVAQRIVARDGKESILSISVKVYGSPKIVAKVPATSFTPKPKVDSAILLIENIKPIPGIGFDEKLFFEVVKAGFAHKRKQLFGNLSEKFGPDIAKKALKTAEISEKTRAENLTLNDWLKLSTELNKFV